MHIHRATVMRQLPGMLLVNAAAATGLSVRRCSTLSAPPLEAAPVFLTAAAPTTVEDTNWMTQGQALGQPVSITLNPTPYTSVFPTDEAAAQTIGEAAAEEAPTTKVKRVYRRRVAAAPELDADGNAVVPPPKIRRPRRGKQAIADAVAAAADGVEGEAPAPKPRQARRKKAAGADGEPKPKRPPLPRRPKAGATTAQQDHTATAAEATAELDSWQQGGEPVDPPIDTPEGAATTADDVPAEPAEQPSSLTENPEAVSAADPALPDGGDSGVGTPADTHNTSDDADEAQVTPGDAAAPAAEGA